MGVLAGPHSAFAQRAVRRKSAMAVSSHSSFHHGTRDNLPRLNA